MRIGIRTLGLFAGVALLAAACGGGGDSEEGSTLIEIEGASGESAAAEEPADTGAQDESQDESQDVEADEAALAFTECMRENGVDIPDFQTNADGSIDPGAGFADSGIDPQDPDVQAAFEACQGELEGASFLPDEQDLTEIEDDLLEFTQCLRDQGLDVADPDLSQGFGQGGGGGGPGGGGGGLLGGDFDPNDPEIQDAISQCQDVFGGQGPFGGAGGGAGGGN